MTTAVRSSPGRRSDNQAPQGRTPLGHRQGRSALRGRATEDDVRRRLAGSSDGGRLTLEQRLDSVWEGLAAGGRAACPVCTAEMGTPGICGGCGSRLS